MRFTLVLIILLSFFSGCENKPKTIADSRVNDYALYDEKGNLHRMSRYNDSKGIVLFLQGNGCPIVRNLLTDFHQIVLDYNDKGFQFFMLKSNPQDNRTRVLEEATTFGFKVPVLLDSGQLLANELDLRITAEVLVLHPTTREILYRGPLNNRLDYETQQNEATEKYLRKALDNILSGERPLTKQEVTRGCTITRLSDTASKVNYTNDIAPILAEYCVKCHNDNGIAPWSMTDYHTVSGWSSMMKQVLLSKRMPPWKADPEVSAFENSLHLPDSNARKIIEWIDNGLTRGKGIDTLESISPVSKGWKYGEPNKIVELKTEEIPATGVIPYRYQEFSLDLSEDTWISGLEIKPGNRKVVHHILLTSKNPDKTNPIVHRKKRKWIDNFIALGGSVDESTIFPDSTGVLFRKDETLVIQIHYTPTGKPEKDQTKLGFYFSEGKPKKEFRSLSPANVKFTIPAYEKNVRIVARDTITKKIIIYSMAPHMHYRGKSIKMKAILPNGDEKVMVSVPDFSFNWQFMYKLENPMSLPAGSIIEVEGIFDNSFQNPLNPDPSKILGFGIQSTDEMLIGFLNYTLD
ncbi:MAG: redoxin domain-containing protein [Flavobacteriaceae bacterium]|nr:redoxin domain-containing protein [Flavobacteriaceae bacterium]